MIDQTIEFHTIVMRSRNQESVIVHSLPEYQNLGLGRIAAESMMTCFQKEMPGCKIWLDTQTWSHKAIGILDLVLC